MAACVRANSTFPALLAVKMPYENTLLQYSQGLYDRQSLTGFGRNSPRHSYYTCRSCLFTRSGGENTRHAAAFEKWADIQLEFLADEVWSYRAYGKNAVYDHGHHGNAILSKMPFTYHSNHDISCCHFHSAVFYMPSRKKACMCCARILVFWHGSAAIKFGVACFVAKNS
jgi:hypothetical protein